MSIRIPAALANLMLDAGIGSVTNAGKLRVYSGSQPSTGGAAVTTQTKLIEFTLNANAFPDAAAGILTAAAIAATVALATGTATWFRLLRADGTTVVLDGAVGVQGSGAECIITTTAIESGETVAVLSLRVIQPLA